jgi:hypothetical protein
LDHRPFEIRQIKTSHVHLLHIAERESQPSALGNPVYGYVT